MGNLIVGGFLLVIVGLAGRSVWRSHKAGRSCACGGDCGSCGHCHK
ncbi:MAG: tetratricopeptide repeat protein [Lawsonibacter sp.]|nr:tetratricopeptide repeat protein [Lawsonibacter sp.]